MSAELDLAVKVLERRARSSTPNEFAVKDQRIPREGFPSTVPPGFDHGTPAMTFQGTTLLPLDVSLPSLREDQTWDSRLSLTVPPVPPACRLNRPAHCKSP